MARLSHYKYEEMEEFEIHIMTLTTISLDIYTYSNRVIFTEQFILIVNLVPLKSFLSNSSQYKLDLPTVIQLLITFYCTCVIEMSPKLFLRLSVKID
jgi:hypothetical protein